MLLSVKYVCTFTGEVVHHLSGDAFTGGPVHYNGVIYYIPNLHFHYIVLA